MFFTDSVRPSGSKPPAENFKILKIDALCHLRMAGTPPTPWTFGAAAAGRKKQIVKSILRSDLARLAATWQ